MTKKKILIKKKMQQLTKQMESEHFDPNGSWTGKCKDKLPVQDADDL
ncbi:MAG: hypothetical protein J6R37_02145 [Clostridia bacterium]|nr:hypothetical protein [Clostridia bacterium]